MQRFGFSLYNNDKPDPAPKSVCVGAANPFALAEMMLGRPIDRSSPSAPCIVSDCLQMDYHELFDMRFNSVLYAGLKLNSKDNEAERIQKKEMKKLTDDDLMTPDMSRVKKIGDLEKVGLKQVLETGVQRVHLQSGKLRLVLEPYAMNKRLSNYALTRPMFETMTPFRDEKDEWTPPNCTWGDVSDLRIKAQRKRMMSGNGRLCRGSGMGMDMDTSMKMGAASSGMPMLQKSLQSMSMMMDMEPFNEPVQGVIPNSWLIAALTAVAWAHPYEICRDNNILLEQPDQNQNKMKNKKMSIKLHSKGGENDAPTATVEVNYEIPINNSTNLPPCCGSSDYVGAIWPSLYEKAFAKWLTKGSSDHPDLTQTSAAAMGGDPIKAMAQITDGEPQYFYTHSRSVEDLVGMVRANCLNFKTIHPMTAFTYASGDMYKGCMLVANHAYTVLGWCAPPEDRQYIVLRNPWGVTEPLGMTAYQGLLDVCQRSVWPPVEMMDHQGVFAIEANVFKRCFACVGIAK